MGQIGEELRRVRELKGMSLREVEEITKIRMKYLIALEADDFAALPGRVYVIGFLRTYARFLGINDEELVNRFKSLSEFVVPDDEPEEKTKPVQRKNRSLFLLAIFGALILFTVFGWFYWNNKNSDTNNPPIEDVPQVQTPDPTKPQENQPQENTDNSVPDEEAEISGVSVTVNIKEATCWLDVNADGENVFRGTMSAGETRTFIGKEKISIVYGNAGAVEVIYNGKTVYPLGKLGQRIVEDYTEDGID